jgi:hypothetical protein
MVFLLDRPAPGLLYGDYKILKVDPSLNTVYYYDGYGVQELGGKYYDPASTDSDEMEVPPVGVEEGDYFTFEKIRPAQLEVVEA